MTGEEDRIRTIAGYLLKNNARLILTAAPEAGAYVKAAVLQAFNDESTMIRNAAGQDVVAFLGQLEPRNWPECLQQLMNTLYSTDLDHQEAAFNILEKACEDYPRKMDVKINGTRPLDFMIPKFLILAEHPSTKVRSRAIACLSYFIPIGVQSLFVHVDTFIATLFKLASDDDPLYAATSAGPLFSSSRPFCLTFAEDADSLATSTPYSERSCPCCSTA
ncbi:armadillo-type protein [Mycena metata]|uniref:Armadillo-type protein n=1 Tax=Mycena metata TaxID=1033252 RepID=A0AAD7K632_9AGAR|nr:armadillo-type protein [Mycena metata]